MNHEADRPPLAPAPRQLQVHGYTRAGRLDRVEVHRHGADYPTEISRDLAEMRHDLSLTCLLFRPTDHEGHDQLLMQVSWNLLHQPRSIWTASSTCLLELTMGTASDQSSSELTTTYGRFGLMNRAWDVLDAGRYYMVAWAM